MSTRLLLELAGIVGPSESAQFVNVSQEQFNQIDRQRIVNLSFQPYLPTNETIGASQNAPFGTEWLKAIGGKVVSYLVSAICAIY